MTVSSDLIGNLDPNEPSVVVEPDPEFRLLNNGDTKVFPSLFPDGVRVTGVLKLDFELGVGVGGGLPLFPVVAVDELGVSGPAVDGEVVLPLGFLKKPSRVVCFP
jgi:hypothetical protein